MLGLLLTLLSVVSGSGAAPDSPFGDADCSGTVTAVDALKVLRGEGGPCVRAYGNVNCWGQQADAVDALHILRHVAGLPQGWQYEPCPEIGDWFPTAVDRQAMIQAAQDYWTAAIGEAAAGLAGVEVEWSLQEMPYCDAVGAAGCAYDTGCLPGSAYPCKAWICSACFIGWPVEALQSVVNHEFGHLLGQWYD